MESKDIYKLLSHHLIMQEDLKSFNDMEMATVLFYVYIFILGIVKYTSEP